MKALLVLLLVGCGASTSTPASTVSVSGTAITVDGPTALRAVKLSISGVTDVKLGPDAAGLNLLRVEMNGTTAKVLVSDTRGVKLPAHGTILTVTGTPTIESVEAADDSEKLVNVVIK